MRGSFCAYPKEIFVANAPQNDGEVFLKMTTYKHFYMLHNYSLKKSIEVLTLIEVCNIIIENIGKSGQINRFFRYI